MTLQYTRTVFFPYQECNQVMKIYFRWGGGGGREGSTMFVLERGSTAT